VDRDPRALEELIAQRRQDLGRNLDALEDEARALVDLRRHYRNHTGTALALAAAAGTFIGLMTARPRRRMASPSATGQRAQRVLHAIDPDNRAVRAAADIRDGIVDALVGVAAAKVADVVSQLIPGFQNRTHAPRRTAIR